MYNSLKENLSSLKSAFANSADFTVRDMILNSDNKTTSAVITIEGMCSKEVIALSIINPIFDLILKMQTAHKFLMKFDFRFSLQVKLWNLRALMRQ